MSAQKSPWILGIVYINPDDSRVLVPLPCKLGLAVNFGNPRAVAVVSWICAILLLVLLVVPIVAHPAYFASDPVPLLWVISANVVALGLIRLNGCFAWSDYRLIALASYGLIAIGIGFSLQGLINRPLVLWWGARNLSWIHYLVLGSVAGIAQTVGRGIAILLLQKTRPVSTVYDYARHGLLVGLGFTIVEITYIYFAVAWAQAPLGYLSVWERVSASMLHIYLGGLVALAFWWRRYLLIALVVAIHALTDFLASAGGSLGFSTFGLETLFSAFGVFTWAIFLLAIGFGARGDWPGKEVQPDGPENGNQPFHSE